MSKPRYNWWPFALNMIRDYPVRVQALKDLRQQNVTADMSGMPRAGGESRITEGVAMRMLPAQEQREYDAVHQALQRTRGMDNGRQREEIVRLSIWRGYSIAGAAMIVPGVSEDTARRYRWQFIMLVGMFYGFLTEEEYRATVKNEMRGRKIGVPEPK